MAKVKITRKGLKEDEVHAWTVRAWRWIEDNQQKILIGCIVILLALGANWAFRSWRAGAQAKMNVAFYGGLQPYQASQMTFDPQERDAALEGAQLAFVEMSEQYSDKPLGRLSQFMHGNVLFDLGRYAEAREAYRTWLDGSESKQDRARGYIALGDCDQNEAFGQEDLQLRQSFLDSALENYEAARKESPKSYLAYFALFNKAKILERDPATQEEAVELFKRIELERPVGDAALIQGIDRKRFKRSDLPLLESIEQVSEYYTLAQMAEMNRNALENRMATAKAAKP